MIIRTELKFDVGFDTPEELAFLEKQIELAGKEAVVGKLTKDIYEVFKEELIEADKVEINVSIIEGGKEDGN